MGESAKWAFRSFLSERGESEVDTWYNGQAPKIQARFDTALKYLRDQPRWEMPYARVLEAECDGLVEIRFRVEKVQYRPLGFYGPMRLEFTITFFATEKGSEFDPPNACATGLRRKTIVKENREGRSCEWHVE